MNRTLGDKVFTCTCVNKVYPALALLFRCLVSCICDQESRAIRSTVMLMLGNDVAHDTYNNYVTFETSHMLHDVSHITYVTRLNITILAQCMISSQT